MGNIKVSLLTLQDKMKVEETLYGEKITKDSTVIGVKHFDCELDPYYLYISNDNGEFSRILFLCGEHEEHINFGEENSRLAILTDTLSVQTENKHFQSTFNNLIKAENLRREYFNNPLLKGLWGKTV